MGGGGESCVPRWAHLVRILISKANLTDLVSDFGMLDCLLRSSSSLLIDQALAQVCFPSQFLRFQPPPFAPTQVSVAIMGRTKRKLPLFPYGQSWSFPSNSATRLEACCCCSSTGASGCNCP